MEKRIIDLAERLFVSNAQSPELCIDQAEDFYRILDATIEIEEYRVKLQEAEENLSYTEDDYEELLIEGGGTNQDKDAYKENIGKCKLKVKELMAIVKRKESIL
jgi:hypothetical protein